MIRVGEIASHGDSVPPSGLLLYSTTGKLLKKSSQVTAMESFEVISDERGRLRVQCVSAGRMPLDISVLNEDTRINLGVAQRLVTSPDYQRVLLLPVEEHLRLRALLVPKGCGIVGTRIRQYFLLRQYIANHFDLSVIRDLLGHHYQAASIEDVVSACILAFIDDPNLLQLD